MPAFSPIGLPNVSPVGFMPPFVYVALETVGRPVVPDAAIVTLQSFAPGIFATANGLAAATVTRVSADQRTTTTTPAVSCSTPGNCQAVAIDLSSGPAYLSLYGTGFTGTVPAAFPNPLWCRIGDQRLVAQWVGPQSQTPGLDQVNLLLQQGMPSGTFAVGCGVSADPTPITNAVLITIK